MNQLLEKYKKEISLNLARELGVKNPMATPRVTKVVVNMGTGTIKDNKEEQEKAVSELASIVGQKPSVRLARRSVAGFNLREGEPVGISATLRGVRMYHFIDKLLNIVLPRLRDFRGVSKRSFDKDGNYTLGFAEHTVFPEIDLGKVSRARGLEVTIVTNTHSPEKSKRLLEEMGMPFEK